MMQELDDGCKSRIFNKYCWTWSEIFVQSFEFGGKLFAYVSKPIKCNDVNSNIRTNHRPQKWEGNTTKYWRLAHRQNYKKIAIHISYRSFSRDVITFQNLKLKIYQGFYPHQTKEVAYLYLFRILQLNSLLRVETRAFWISGLCRCVTQGYDRVCWKIYTYLMILSPFRSWSIRKRVYVNTCIFSTVNQSSR